MLVGVMIHYESFIIEIYSTVYIDNVDYNMNHIT